MKTERPEIVGAAQPEKKGSREIPGYILVPIGLIRKVQEQTLLSGLAGPVAIRQGVMVFN